MQERASFALLQCQTAWDAPTQLLVQYVQLVLELTKIALFAQPDIQELDVQLALKDIIWAHQFVHHAQWLVPDAHSVMMQLHAQFVPLAIQEILV